MKKVALVSILLMLAGSAMAVNLAGQDVATTVDLTYMSKYIWRGFDLYDDTSAWQPSLDLQFENGFGANVWASYAGSSGFVDGTEYDYTLTYNGSALEGCWQTDYTVGWRYYDYIDRGSEDADVQEVFVEGAMPNLVEGGVTPHFAVYQMWSAEGGTDALVRDWTGTIYVMGFTYGVTFDQAPELPVNFLWDIVYNDGTGGDTVDHDWSHMVWGVSTNFQCPMTGATVTPALYFQNSFEDSVNTQDELWGGVSYSLTF